MNRETWLTNAVKKLSDIHFTSHGLGFEHPIKISTGWCRGSKKAIGQCWSNLCSSEGFVEIFISPVLQDPVEVLATTLHELIHAHLGNGKGHGKEFTKLAREMGLAGRITATFAEPGSDLYKQLEMIAQELGEYPHRRLTPSETKKEGSGEEKKGAWIRFKSAKEPTFRCMVSPKSIEQFGIPKDPWGDELIPTK